jgi:hypothetical protein
MKQIVALDPGGTTGVAVLTFDASTKLWHRKQLGPQEHHYDLYQELCQHLNCRGQETPLTVVCEGFQYRNDYRPGLVLVSREYIGVAKFFCQEFEVSYVEQSAGQGKAGKRTFVRPEHIKKLGMWLPGKPHAMDATAHLLYYVIHGKHNDSDLLQYRMELLNKGWK